MTMLSIAMAGMNQSFNPEPKPSPPTLTDEYVMEQMKLINQKVCELPFRKREQVRHLYNYRRLDRAGRA